MNFCARATAGLLLVDEDRVSDGCGKSGKTFANNTAKASVVILSQRLSEFDPR
jgi:hypothetical protein